METNNTPAVITLPMISQAEMPQFSHALVRVLSTALSTDRAVEDLTPDILTDYLYVLDNTIKPDTHCAE